MWVTSRLKPFQLIGKLEERFQFLHLWKCSTINYSAPKPSYRLALRSLAPTSNWKNFCGWPCCGGTCIMLALTLSVVLCDWNGCFMLRFSNFWASRSVFYTDLRQNSSMVQFIIFVQCDLLKTVNRIQDVSYCFCFHFVFITRQRNTALLIVIRLLCVIFWPHPLYVLNRWCYALYI